MRPSNAVRTVWDAEAIDTSHLGFRPIQKIVTIHASSGFIRGIPIKFHLASKLSVSLSLFWLVCSHLSRNLVNRLVNVQPESHRQNNQPPCPRLPRQDRADLVGRMETMRKRLASVRAVTVAIRPASTRRWTRGPFSGASLSLSQKSLCLMPFDNLT